MRILRRTSERDYRPQHMWAVLLAFGAAIGYAAASVLQHREAEADQELHDGGVRLVLRLARRPLWLAGLGCDGLGYVCQALALGLGALLVVQPVITSGILFALPASAWWAGRRLGRGDYAWAAVLAVGLTVFLMLAGTEGGKDDAEHHRLAVVRGDRRSGARGRASSPATRSTGTRRAVLFAFTCGALFGHHRRAHQGLGGAGGRPRLRRAHPLGALRPRGDGRARLRAQPAGVPGRFAHRVAARRSPWSSRWWPCWWGSRCSTRRCRRTASRDWIAIALATVAMIASTVQLSRSAARFDEIHEHELADVLTRDAPARRRRDAHDERRLSSPAQFSRLSSGRRAAPRR